jgi:hypothetical protein
MRNSASSTAHLDVELGPIARWPKATQSCSEAAEADISVTADIGITTFTINNDYYILVLISSTIVSMLN